jgi:hypothetical protein
LIREGTRINTDEVLPFFGVERGRNLSCTSMPLPETGIEILDFVTVIRQ